MKYSVRWDSDYPNPVPLYRRLMNARIDTLVRMYRTELERLRDIEDNPHIPENQ